MALKIKWSPRAASNLEEICDYIAKDSQYYAILFAKKVTNIVKAIPQFPQSGRIVPEYGDENLREKIYENYRIVYRLKGKEAREEKIRWISLGNKKEKFETLPGYF